MGSGDDNTVPTLAISQSEIKPPVTRATRGMALDMNKRCCALAKRPPYPLFVARSRELVINDATIQTYVIPTRQLHKAEMTNEHALVTETYMQRHKKTQS